MDGWTVTAGPVDTFVTTTTMDLQKRTGCLDGDGWMAWLLWFRTSVDGLLRVLPENPDRSEKKNISCAKSIGAAALLRLIYAIHSKPFCILYTIPASSLPFVPYLWHSLLFGERRLGGGLELHLPLLYYTEQHSVYRIVQSAQNMAFLVRQ